MTRKKTIKTREIRIIYEDDIKKRDVDPTVPQGPEFDDTGSLGPGIIEKTVKKKRPVRKKTRVKKFWTTHKEKIIIGILLAFLGFAAKYLFDLNGSMGKFSERVNGNKEDITEVRKDVKNLEEENKTQSVDIGKMKYKLKID